MFRALICATLLHLALSVDMETILTNTDGYKLDTKVTYLIAVPNKIRPNQVVQVFTTITRLEYGPIQLQVSIVRDKFEYGRTSMVFNMAASRIMQLQISQNLPPGQYKIKIQANPSNNPSGYVFTREADILFDNKYASVFIQTNKPVYCQGQMVHFRVVQVYPDLMPVYGSLTIYVKDPSGYVVRRWFGQQTNAGGIVSESFEIADQPRYGDWSIAVHASNIVHMHKFRVEEFWTPRFDVNVTVSPYFMDDVESVRGVIMANHTSGKATIGSATIKLTIVPPNQKFDYNRTNNHLPSLQKNIEYFNGRIDFQFGMSEIRNEMNRKFFGTLRDSELLFNVTVNDWFLAMSQNGSATSHVFSSKVKLQWVGDPVRSFKPNTHISVTLALMKEDGSRVDDERKPVTMQIDVKNTNGNSSPYKRELKKPVKGLVTFELNVGDDIDIITFTASYEDSESIKLVASRYFSESQTYISVTTSTKNPMVNEFMVFHVKTSTYVEKVFYLIVAKGSILIGDELLMGSSRQKTFSVALSRRMVPTARIVVYFIRSADEEVVVDVLNFYINGIANNKVQATFNRGKDFTRDTIEINAFADPGSYVAFAAVPYDLYIRGMGAGITQNQLIDELYTYDKPANSTYRHLWRVSEAEYEYMFFSANGYGMDASSTFLRAGLLILTDANITEKSNTCDTGHSCFLSGCYTDEQRCDKNFDCADGADEHECDYAEDTKLITDIDRVSRIQRFYDDSSWIWQEYFVKPDGRVDFRIKTPKYPLTWVMHGLSISRDLGLGIMSAPVMYDAARYMYIQVEAPTYIVRGEQVGFRVTVFNFWDKDDFIEVLVTAHASPYHKFVLVGELGLVQSYSPELADGDMQTIVFLEPGQSKDIYMPVIPIIQNGCFDVEISASCFMERDFVLHRVCVKSDGVLNYYHIPYMVDLITQSSVIVPNFDIPINAQFIQPEQREHDYVPGSGKAASYIFGDVVTPGFFEEYLNAENILYRPYGVAENIIFNFAYNVLTLKFKKASMQLSDETLRTSLKYLNVAMQRILSYMNEDGSFSMSRDKDKKSIWLTAFAAKTLHSAREGEWESDLFVPLELIKKMVSWICSQQNTTGVFDTEHFVYDRKMSARSSWNNGPLKMDPMALTAYVYIALHSVSKGTNDAGTCAVTARKSAELYLSDNSVNIKNEDIFTLAITTYALSLSNQKSATIYNRLWSLHQGKLQKFFAEAKYPIPANPSTLTDNIRYLQPRVEQINDAFSVQTTAYALLANIKLVKSKDNRDSVMKWLNSMRNTVGGMSSTQDTITAMEALYEYTQVDPNRNVFRMQLDVWSVANNNSKKLVYMTKSNYTHMSIVKVEPNVYSYVRAQVLGTGRAMFQVTTTVNVEYKKQLKQSTKDNIYDIKIDTLRFTGRNDSILEMNICVSWKFKEWSEVSGMSVLEVDIPTGYVVLNSTLRQYVQAGIVPNLMRAESYNRKIVFYFESLDESYSCVFFRANRWYPVANATMQHRIRVYDYYEPGLYLTSLYETNNLFRLNICYVCGSFQCPYCPQFNKANIIKSTIAIICILFTNLVKSYMLRNS
ncbi:C3 and PZP-like alpha-2-macroglobulin domain-containing protein 8 [Argonauta hians]